MNRILIAGIALLAALSISSFARTMGQDEARAAWQIVKYDITGSVNQANRSLNAVTTVTLKNVGRGSGSNFTLRLNSKAKVTAITSDSASAAFHSLPDSRPNLQRVNITLASPIAAGNSLNVVFTYTLPVDTNTGLEGVTPLGTQFRPESFWYPVLNTSYTLRGIDTAPFRLHIDGGALISSGTEKDSSSYEQTLNGQPFFLQGTWERVEGVADSKGITAYVVGGAPADEKKQAEALVSLAAAARGFYSSLFGNAPATPIRLVSVRRGAGFGDGGTILIERAAFRRAKVDAGTALTVAESVARLWIGGQTPVRGEGSAVIREALPRYLALLFIEKQFGRNASDAELLRERMAQAIVAKRDGPLSRMTPLDDTYFSSLPNKGAMVWRLVDRRLGHDAFVSTLKSLLQSPEVTLAAVRSAFSALGGEAMKSLLDYELDQPTEMDLMIGTPQVRGAESVAALRNLGTLDAVVNVTGTTATGEQLQVNATIPAQNFAEAVFKTNAKLVRVEVDPEKLYPQLDYSNDSAPRVRDVADAMAEASRFFGAQDFGRAEVAAREIMASAPNMQEARILLARALLGGNKPDEAEKIFRSALDEPLPTANTLAWANVGLGEIALRKGQGSEAAKRFNDAARTEGEYASALAARAGRIKAEGNPTVDESIRNFLSQLDKDITTGTKADVDAKVVPGELTRFVNGLVGTKPDVWQTRVLRTEQWDPNLAAADVSINSKVLGKEASGTAVLMLAKINGAWKLTGIELFEVR